MLSWTLPLQRGWQGDLGEVSRGSLHGFSSRLLPGHEGVPQEGCDSQAGCFGMQPLHKIPTGGLCGAWLRVILHGMWESCLTGNAKQC